MVGPMGDGRVGRRWAPLVVTLGTVVAAAALVWAVGSGGDAEVSVEETTTSQAPERGRDAFPAPMALGAPDDGKESVGLPVRAEPAAGLLHGQEVTVTGTGFPPGESVGVVMCAREAGRDHGARGAEACNLGRFVQATSGPDGVVVVAFTVSRLVVLDGVEIDCASEPGRCLIGMGMISDYDTSGGTLVDFDPGAPLPDPPTATLERTTDLVSGEPVGLTVTGLLPGSPLSVEVCGAGACGGFPMITATAGDDGVLRTAVRLWRAFGVHASQPGQRGSVDCAREPCQVSFHADVTSGRAIPTLEVRFDPAFDAPTFPVATVLAEGPFSPGDDVPIRITGLPTGARMDASVCHPSRGECAGAGGTADDEGVVDIELTLPRAADLASCECLLVFGAYWERETTADERPLLHPDPVPIAIAG